MDSFLLLFSPDARTNPPRTTRGLFEQFGSRVDAESMLSPITALRDPSVSIVLNFNQNQLVNPNAYHLF